MIYKNQVKQTYMEITMMSYTPTLTSIISKFNKDDATALHESKEC